MTSLTLVFAALVSDAFLLLVHTIMLYFEKSLRVFLLLQNCAENCQEK